MNDPIHQSNKNPGRSRGVRHIRAFVTVVTYAAFLPPIALAFGVGLLASSNACSAT
jgi:hypothetical protein